MQKTWRRRREAIRCNAMRLRSRNRSAKRKQRTAARSAIGNGGMGTDDAESKRHRGTPATTRGVAVPIALEITPAVCATRRQPTFPRPRSGAARTVLDRNPGMISFARPVPRCRFASASSVPSSDGADDEHARTRVIAHAKCGSDPSPRKAGGNRSPWSAPSWQQDATEWFARGRAEQSIALVLDRSGSREALRPERPS